MADKGESKFSWLLFITSIIIFLLFISVIGLAYMKFNFTYKELKSDFNSADAISLQITLLGIILTALALGGGIVAFIGWKGLQKTAKKTAQETAEKTVQEVVEKTVQETVEDKINNNVAPEIEKIVKDVLDKINVSSQDKTDEEKYFKK